MSRRVTHLGQIACHARHAGRGRCAPGTRHIRPTAPQHPGARRSQIRALNPKFPLDGSVESGEVAEEAPDGREPPGGVAGIAR